MDFTAPGEPRRLDPNDPIDRAILQQRQKDAEQLAGVLASDRRYDIESRSRGRSRMSAPITEEFEPYQPTRWERHVNSWFGNGQHTRPTPFQEILLTASYASVSGWLITDIAHLIVR
jgi:hypothetical protein